MDDLRWKRKLTYSKAIGKYLSSFTVNSLSIVVTEIVQVAEYNHYMLFDLPSGYIPRGMLSGSSEQRSARDWIPQIFFPPQTCWNASSGGRNMTMQIRLHCQWASKQKQKQAPGGQRLFIFPNPFSEGAYKSNTSSWSLHYSSLFMTSFFS